VMLTADEFLFSRVPWLTPQSEVGQQGADTRFLLSMKPGQTITVKQARYKALRSAAYRRSIPCEGGKIGRGNYVFKRLA
jgi:hypothetical protein